MTNNIVVSALETLTPCY